MSYEPTKRERMKNFMGTYIGAERIEIGFNELGNLTGHAPSGLYAAVKWECENRGWTYRMKDSTFIITPSKKELLTKRNFDCLGGYMEEDPFCGDCDQKVKCIVETEELEAGESDLNSIVEEKQEVSSLKADPLDSEKDRLELLCLLDVDQLVLIANILGININHLDLQDKGVENELVVEIDLFIEVNLK